MAIPRCWHENIETPKLKPGNILIKVLSVWSMFRDGDITFLPTPLLSKPRIHNVLGQYHSASEHRFLWIVDADDPHLIEEFALEASLASFNKLTIVPLNSLKEGVISRIKKVHGL